MQTVVLVGTLDTKGREYAYLRDRLQEAGLIVLVIDAGVLGPPFFPADVDRSEVAEAAGARLEALAGAGDRGTAVDTMARGAALQVLRLRAEGRLDGVLGMGGSGGTTIAAAAMRALPFGVPKLLVSTMASGNVGPYVDGSDIMMLYPIVDLSGLNRISMRILERAAAAMAGMLAGAPGPPPEEASRPLVGASLFGVTTPCVDTARVRLEELGYEVLPFHGTGIGGRSLEGLVRSGTLDAVLDVTTTELADDLVGGICSAGPDRLTAAAERGVPQVVSVGAMDMVNFGPAATVPERFRSRRLHSHNANVTLMRTSPTECQELGRRVAGRLNASRGPCALFIPLRGTSSLSTEGQPFFDPEADRALFDALRHSVAPTVEVYEMDTDINDPAFARAMADTLHGLRRRVAP
jgi:uncharacterized protein (UPF0261 family)